MPELTCLCVLGTQWISGRWAASWRNSSPEERSSRALTVSFQHCVFVRCFTSREGRERDHLLESLGFWSFELLSGLPLYSWFVTATNEHFITSAIHAVINEARKGFMVLLDYGSNQVFIKSYQNGCRANAFQSSIQCDWFLLFHCHVILVAG